MANALDLAAAQIGLNETDKKAALQDYLTTGGANLDPATTAWCAAFVNSTLNQSGMKGTGSNLARSFLNWGTETKEPQRGDLAVFKRGNSSWQGHVGFFDGINPDGTIRVLGGNQGDAVSIAAYSPDDLLGYRRAGEPSDVTGTPFIPSGGGNALATQPQPRPENALGQYRPRFQYNNFQLDPNAFKMV